MANTAVQMPNRIIIEMRFNPRERFRRPRAKASSPKGANTAENTVLSEVLSELVVEATVSVAATVVGFEVTATDACATAHVTYVTGLVQVSATVPSNPPWGVRVMVAGTVPPTATETAVGDTAKVKALLDTVSV